MQDIRYTSTVRTSQLNHVRLPKPGTVLGYDSAQFGPAYAPTRQRQTQNPPKRFGRVSTPHDAAYPLSSTIYTTWERSLLNSPVEPPGRTLEALAQQMVYSDWVTVRCSKILAF